MRLIDADDAINIFTNRLFETLKTNFPCVTATENQICLDTCYKVAKYEIDNIPTACSIDNILEKLEERRIEYELSSENAPDDVSSTYRKGVMRGYEYSRDLVKQEINNGLE